MAIRSNLHDGMENLIEHLYLWEVEMVERFLLTIQGKRLVIDMEDKVLWKETKDEKFSIKSFIVLLSLEVQHHF